MEAYQVLQKTSGEINTYEAELAAVEIATQEIEVFRPRLRKINKDYGMNIKEVETYKVQNRSWKVKVLKANKEEKGENISMEKSFGKNPEKKKGS